MSRLSNFISSISPDLLNMGREVEEPLATQASPEQPGLAFPASVFTPNPVNERPVGEAVTNGVDGMTMPLQSRPAQNYDRRETPYNMADYRRAIRAVESDGSGGYSAVGPVTKKGNRAYGAYQVMDFNIPSWTKRHYGRSLTPQEFLKNEAAQDAVFDGEFGRSLKTHGNFDDATSIWFSGRPVRNAGNSSDGYNTVPQYINKARRALGRAPLPGASGPYGKSAVSEGAMDGFSPDRATAWGQLDGYEGATDPMKPSVDQDEDFAEALASGSASMGKEAGYDFEAASGPPDAYPTYKPETPPAMLATEKDFKTYLNGMLQDKDRQSPSVQYFEKMVNMSAPKLATALSITPGEADELMRATAADYAASPDQSGLSMGREVEDVETTPDPNALHMGTEVEDIDMGDGVVDPDVTVAPSELEMDEDGEIIAAPATDTASPTTGGGGASAGSATPDQSGVADVVAPASGFIDRMMDKFYGPDADPEARQDRKRAITLALAEGFRELGGGPAADYRGISNDRVASKEARKAANQLKADGQSLSDLMVASGRPDLAQLPLMGKEGMAAAMQVLTTQAPSNGGSPAYRAALAATLSENGHPALARGILTETGEAWDNLHKSVLGMEADRAKPATGSYALTQQQRAAAADQLARAGRTAQANAVASGAASDAVIADYLKDIGGSESDGEQKTWSPEARAEGAQIYAESNPHLAWAFKNGAPDKVLNDLMIAEGEVSTAIATTAGNEVVKSQVQQDAERAGVRGLAQAYRTMGREDLAAAAEGAATAKDAIAAIDQVERLAEVRTDRDLTKERGTAFANTIDKSKFPELHAAAMAAQTSQDLAQVYDRLTDVEGRTVTQKDVERLMNDPNYSKAFYSKAYIEAGGLPRSRMAEQLFVNEIQTYASNFSDSRAAREKLRSDNAAVRKMLTNPAVKTGSWQEHIAIPLQKMAYSVFGDDAAAFDLANNPTLVAQTIMKMSQNANFATAAADLKGAMSDRESAAFMSLFPTIGDSRVQALAATQFVEKAAALRDAEHQAMLDWTAMVASDENGKWNRTDMLDYVAEKTAGMEVFKTFDNAADLADYQNSGKAIDPYEIIIVRNSRGVGSMYAVKGPGALEELLGD